jgi:hypothetical protein
MLGDGDKTVANKITKDLKMFLFINNCRIRTHQEEISLTYFHNWHKITNENIPFLSKFDQDIECFQK